METTSYRSNSPYFVPHRAVSNETIAGGTIAQALKGSFPGLTTEDISDLEAHYPLSAFSSADEQFRSATGDPLLRCAVRQHCVP